MSLSIVSDIDICGRFTTYLRRKAVVEVVVVKLVIRDFVFQKKMLCNAFKHAHV